MNRKALWSVIFCLFLTHQIVQSIERPSGNSKSFRGISKGDITWKDVLKFQEPDAGDNSKRPVIDAIKRALHDLLQNLMSSGFPTAVANSSVVNSQCIEDSITYVHSVYNFSIWALQMKESSGNLPIGMFGSGNFHADGLFDECLAIRPPVAPYDGQYCTVYFRPERITVEPEVRSSVLDALNVEERSINLVTLFQLLGMSASGQVEPKVSEAGSLSYAFPSVSFCLPASCSAADLGYAVADLVGGFAIGNYSIVTVADERYCFKADKEPIKYDGADITVMILLSLLALISVLATAFEIRLLFKKDDSENERNKVTQAVLCFSLIGNTRRILSMRKSKSPENLGYVHGIRALSILWVLIGHTWLKGAASNSVNPNMLDEDGLAWWFQGIANATISVDTFLVISGLLASFLLLRELDKKNGKINFPLLYLHRYLRLTIVYGLVLGFIATLIIYVGTGPNWFNVLIASYGCRINWWQHLLYINNLFPTDIDVQCMAQTWYLALDMQLFILSPIFIYILWRWRKAGLGCLAFLMTGCLAANFAVIAVFDLTPTLMLTRPMDNIQMGTDQDYYYTKPWTRAPPYIIGVFLGWLLYLERKRDSRIRIPAALVALMWTGAAAVGLSVIYGLIPYLDEAEVPEIDPAISIIYGSLHRTAWAAVVAWIVYACDTGYGGFVNKILSWRGFLPLSRLSYCVYLLHYEYLTVFYAENRKLIYYTFSSQLTTYFGICVTVYLLAFIVSATIEAPFINLEKVFLSPKRADESAAHNTPQRNNIESSFLDSFYKKPAVE